MTTATREIVDNSEIVMLFAHMLDGAERERISLENRLRTLTRDDEYGKGYPEWHPDVMAAQEMLDDRRRFEKAVVKRLERSMKDHPLGPWCESTKGVGLKTLGRLIGTLGNPYWHSREDRPRRIRELRAYCGLHVVEGKAPRRRKGVQGNWKTMARTRLYLIAEAMVKNTSSAYRHVYDETRTKYEDAEVDGKPIRPAQQHARAMRKVMVTVLNDLWDEARRLTEAGVWEPMVNEPDEESAL